jgi:hypothetical protein
MTKFEANIPFLAHCITCDKEVSALSLLNRGDLLKALQGEADVRVMHVVSEKDHIWSLNSQDKLKLSDAIAKGLA